MGFLGIKFPEGFTPIPEVVGNELLMLYSPTTGKIHQSELGLLSFGVDEQAVIDLVNTNTSVNVYNAARLGGELPNYYAPASSLTNYYTKTNLQTSGQAQVHWSNLTSKPTTLSGYGITDALKVDENGNLIVCGNILATGGITAYSTGSLGDIWDNMPVATASTLGGIKVGESLIIEDGVLNINGDTFNLTNYYTKAQTDSLLSGKFDKTGGSITGDVSITGNLTITGLGKEFIADVQTVQIADNLAVLNYGETGAGVTAGFAGWEIDRGTATHYRFGLTESVGYFQVGKIGSLQTVATREDVPLSNGFARWNATLKRFDTVVINNIVTGTGTAGQISYWNGTGSQAGSSNLVWDNTSGSLSLPNGPGGRGVSINNSGGIRFISTSTGGWVMAINSYDSSGTFMNPLIGAYGLANSHSYTYIGGRGYTDAAIYAHPNSTVSIGKPTVTSGYKLDVNGAIRAAGNIYATGNITGAGEVTAYTASDARLKTNITSLNNINALDIINALNPVTYTWNSKAVQLNPNKNTTGINYGIIAQELEQIVPDLIRPIYGDYKTYDDRGLMTIMLQAIKELKSKVDKLENKN